MKERKALEDLVQKISDGTATDEEKALFGKWMPNLDLSPVEMQEMSTEDIRAAMLNEILSGPAVSEEELSHRQEEIFPHQEVVIPWRREEIFPRRRWYHIPSVRYASSAAAVLLTVGGLWLWQRMRQSRPDSGPLTVISNAGRQARHIHLPDSTEVWLNSGSAISFSEQDYTSRERRVTLQGEGYFRVVKDPKPFVVSAGGIDTRVLATAFNIESYTNESEVRVTLLQGKVRVEDERRPDRKIVLAPDEVMHYSRRKADWTVEHTEAIQVIQWINGHLVFHELPLEEALGRMEKRYGIEFNYDSSLLAGKNVTAYFGVKPWQQVLDDLLFVHDLSYHQKNGVIYITKQ